MCGNQRRIALSQEYLQVPRSMREDKWYLCRSRVKKNYSVEMKGKGLTVVRICEHQTVSKHIFKQNFSGSTLALLQPIATHDFRKLKIKNHTIRTPTANFANREPI